MAQKQEKLFSAFVDLVGTREIIRRGIDEYDDAIGTFQQQVCDLSVLLGKTPNAGVYFFADCAYIQSPSDKALADFLDRLRWNLFLEGLYFKGAMRPGGLSAKDASQLAHVASTRPDSRVKGYYFGSSVGLLYAREQDLKGIGVDVSLEQVKFGKEKFGVDPGLTVPSCSLASDSSIGIRAISDLRIRVDEFHNHAIASGALESLLRSFFMAKSHAKKLGRFYVTALVTWVSSWDPEQRSNTGAPGDIASAILNPDFERLFGDVVGIEAVYFALLNRSAHQRQQGAAPMPRMYSQIRGFIRSKPALLRRIGRVPSSILTPSVVQDCLGSMPSEIVRGRQEESEAASLVEQLRKQNMTPALVAKELEARHVAHPIRGRAWDVRGVLSLMRKRGIR